MRASQIRFRPRRRRPSVSFATAYPIRPASPPGLVSSILTTARPAASPLPDGAASPARAELAQLARRMSRLADAPRAAGSGTGSPNGPVWVGAALRGGPQAAAVAAAAAAALMAVPKRASVAGLQVVAPLLYKNKETHSCMHPATAAMLCFVSLAMDSNGSIPLF